MVNTQTSNFKIAQYQEEPTSITPPPPTYEPPKQQMSSILYVIGAIGIVVWALALWAYEIYQWTVAPPPYTSWITGMALISFTIGIGATLAGLTGFAYWKDTNHNIGLYGFILGLLLGWILFASDLIDLMSGTPTTLGGYVWIAGYILMGVLVLVWSVLGTALLNAAGASQSTISISRWLIIIGGIANIGWIIFLEILALALFITPVGLLIIAITIWRT